MLILITFFILSTQLYSTRSQDLVFPGLEEQHQKRLPRHCIPVAYIPPIRKREDLGDLLRQFRRGVGVELGVQAGHFANALCRRWKKVEEFVLVDIWSQQHHYLDVANVKNNVQDQFYKQALTTAK